jgi:hypothetical protein
LLKKRRRYLLRSYLLLPNDPLLASPIMERELN